MRLLPAILLLACSQPPAPAPAPAPTPAPSPVPVPTPTPSPSPSPTPTISEEPGGDIVTDPAYVFESFPVGDYPLDTVERIVGTNGRITCPEVPKVVYKGDIVRYHKPVRVYTAFRERLHRFEEVVRDVAIEVYGRAPRRIQHFGTDVCRRMKGQYQEFISEHAFANAIDVAGFDFDYATKAQRAAAPAGLRGKFSIWVDRHWHGTQGHAAIHARFLRLLVERLAARADIFRVMLGPGYPNHDNHFHFDASVFRLIDMEGYGR